MRSGVNGTVNVAAIVAEAPLGYIPLLVVVLSFLVITLDGYNYLCLSFVAPALAGQLHIRVADFAPIFSSGYIGVLIGGIVIGPMSDKLGRKGVLLASVALFGVCSLLPIADLSYRHLLAYRFMTGLGLGGAIPSAITLTAEYAPRRRRGLLVNLMFAGIATGAVVGGLLASRLVPAYGWQSAFWIGGIPSLLLLPVLAVLMPESITFLAASGRRPAYIGRLLHRVDRRYTYDTNDRFIGGPATEQRSGRIADLFRERRAAGTLLIWAASFCSLFAFGMVVSWLPSVLTGVGMPLRTAILGPVVLNIGGLMGSLLLGLLLDRLGFSVIISIALAFAAAGLVLVGEVIGAVGPAFASIFGAGLFLVGAINSTNALMAAFYPVRVRGTGVGWALGVGRTGGILGPALGGAMLQLAPARLFMLCAVVAALGAASMVALAALYPAFRRRPAKLPETKALTPGAMS
jgi:MFS transporter, AAHS family, 4-hydroxybenzoate transporter